MITTIQLHEEVKKELDLLKVKSNESYEDVITKLITYVEKQKRGRKQLLKEGYREMSEESLKVTKEWSNTEADWEL